MPTSKVGSELRYSAPSKHSATVIFLHGLGDDGHGWAPLAHQWHKKFKKFEYVDFVFPHAPSRPITVNGGMTMPGWYDIRSLGAIDTRSEDEAGIKETTKYIQDLIAAEMASKGISSERIVLGGFSQGGAMSLFSGLTSSQKLGGIVGLSCYLLLKDKVQELAVESGNVNKDTKIFMGHGDIDPVVRYEYGKMTSDALKQMGFQVDFRTYPGLPHSSDPKEIEDLEEFLKGVIPPVAEASGASQGNL